VIYYEDWIVTDPGDTKLTYKQLLSDKEYKEARETYGEAFQAGMGAEAIQKLLADTKLTELREELQKQIVTTKSKAKRKKDRQNGCG